MQEYVHYGEKISEIQKKMMISQVDGLTVLAMVEKEMSEMINFGGCVASKSCKRCEKFPKCVRERVSKKIIER